MTVLCSTCLRIMQNVRLVHTYTLFHLDSAQQHLDHGLPVFTSAARHFNLMIFLVQTQALSVFPRKNATARTRIGMVHYIYIARKSTFIVLCSTKSSGLIDSEQVRQGSLLDFVRVDQQTCVQSR